MPQEKIDITVPPHELPEPGEIVEIEQEGFVILIENTRTPGEVSEDTEEALDTVQDLSPNPIRYVPVDITAPGSLVRHAAAIYQRRERTRVGRYALCDRSKGRKVARRRDNEPLTNVTCTQCRAHLEREGVL